MGAPRATRDSGFRTLTGICLLALTLSAVLALAGGSAKSAVAADAQGPLAVPGELIVGFEDDASKSAQSKALCAGGRDEGGSLPADRRGCGRGCRRPRGRRDEAPPREPARSLRRAELPRTDDGDAERPVVRPALGPAQHRPDRRHAGRRHRRARGVGRSRPEARASSSASPTRASTSVTPTSPPSSGSTRARTAAPAIPAVVCAQRTDGVDNDTNGYVDDWRGWDFANNDNNPVDDHGHGTHVSGTIGAVGNNATGVAGVNWNVKIMALKFLDADGLRRRRPARSARRSTPRTTARRSPQLLGRRPLRARRSSTRSSTARAAGCSSSRPPGTTRATTTRPSRTRRATRRRRSCPWPRRTTPTSLRSSPTTAPRASTSARPG